MITNRQKASEFLKSFSQTQLPPKRRKTSDPDSDGNHYEAGPLINPFFCV